MRSAATDALHCSSSDSTIVTVGVLAFPVASNTLWNTLPGDVTVSPVSIAFLRQRELPLYRSFYTGCNYCKSNSNDKVHGHHHHHRHHCDDDIQNYIK